MPSTYDLAIDTKGLTKQFGDLVAVNHLDLAIRKSSIFGFLGPNGSGKSTTIRMLCGLLTPTSGSIEVMGYDIPRQAEALKKEVGYMTQNFSLYGDLTVTENLDFMGQIFGIERRQLKQRINELLAIYSLEPNKKQMAASMSGGQRQRLALAASVLHKPALLFLDEPTSAVDPENRRDFWEKLFDLSEQGTTILVSTHYMDEAERCHNLAIMDRGTIKANGTPQHLMQNLGATVVEVKGSHLRTLKKEILTLPTIHSVAQQGIRLRVLVDDKIDDPVNYLKQKIQQKDTQFQITHPSLEDVFVIVTGGLSVPGKGSQTK
ncbi:MAG TPA: ABC transporter ATP-binding protein [Aeromonadales bacterium]|nr:ABC transporter ATP-binding protein [Aeromonadales bacterium]